MLRQPKARGQKKHREGKNKEKQVFEVIQAAQKNCVTKSRKQNKNIDFFSLRACVCAKIKIKYCVKKVCSIWVANQKEKTERKNTRLRSATKVRFKIYTIKIKKIYRFPVVIFP